VNVAESRYQVLIVGCGNIAGGFDMKSAPGTLPLTHAGGYTSHGGFQLRACVDPDFDRRRSFAAHWGVGAQASDLVSLCPAVGEFDVISICSPTSLHHEHLAQAIDLRPKVIFCEKPLTADASSAEQFVEDCGKRGVTLVVNYSRYWDPSLSALIQEVHEGRWGEVRSAVAHYNKGILNNGGHMVELLFRLLGPMAIVATASPALDFPGSDPSVAVMLPAHEGKVPVYLSPANARDYAYFELEIVCSCGVIRMQSGGMSWQVREVTSSTHFAGYNSLKSARQSDGRYQESMSLAVGNIYDHLSVGAKVGSTGRHALRVQKLCLEIQDMAFSELNRKATTEVFNE
jgi:predicted dehydrogenase